MTDLALSEYSQGSVQEYFIQMVEALNAAGEDPLNPNKNYPQLRFPFFPIKSDSNQLYYLLKEFYKEKLFDQLAFIITTKEYTQIHEFFIMKFIPDTNEEEIGTAKERMKFEIICISSEENNDFLNEVQNKVANFDKNVFSTVSEYVKSNYDIDLGFLFIIPENIARVGILEDISYLNSDFGTYFKDFIRRLKIGMGKELKRMPVIQYSNKQNRNNPIIKIFIKLATVWSDVEVNNIIDFIVNFFESLSLNMLLFNNEDIPVAISRINLENGKIHINPVPLDFLKKYLIEDENQKATQEEITKALFKRTKTQTIPLRVDEISKVLGFFTSKDYTFPEAVLDFVQFFYNGRIYPDSILAIILADIGLNCSIIMPRIKEGIKKLIEYFGKIVFGLLTRTNSHNRKLSELYQIYLNESNKVVIESIICNECVEIFKNKRTPEAIEELDGKLKEDKFKKKLGEVSLIAIIKKQQLLESFSYEQLKNTIEMSKFLTSLPNISAISEIMTSIQNKDVSGGTTLSESEKTEIETEEKAESSGKMAINLAELIPFVEKFLNKGVTVRISEEKRLPFLKDGIQLPEGHLGLDLNKIRKFIKENFPEYMLI